MAASVEICDAVFCQEHIKEVCDDCGADFREENDSFYGIDPVDRDAMTTPAVSQNDDGVYTCNKHGSGTCSQCFGWKKQITRLRTAAKKH